MSVISSDNRALYLPIRRASAVVDEKRRTVLVDHTEGFSAYTIQTGNRFATYVTGEDLSGLPYTAAYGEDDRIVVVGGGQGKAYIFNVMGGSPIGVLQHARAGRVQHLAVSI